MRLYCLLTDFLLLLLPSSSCDCSFLDFDLLNTSVLTPCLLSTDLRSWDLFSPSKKDCNETEGSVFEGVT